MTTSVFIPSQNAVTEEEVQSRFDYMDKNKDKIITQQEFVQVDEWSDEEKKFRARFLELSSEADKQLAFANTALLRTAATEKRLWLKH